MADITLDKLRAVLPPGVTVSSPLVGGQGGQGTVFRGSCNGTDAAIKVFKTDTDTRRIDREIELLSTLNCPHVVRLLHHLGAVIDTEPVRVLAYELHTGGDLNQHLRPGASTVTGEEVLRIGAQVATAIDTLWSKRIVHRDIKPANIVRAADGRYVLVDVGFARHLDRSDITIPGGAPGNLLNQYTGRTVPGTVDLMGFASAANTVTFATPPGGTPVAADFRWNEFYQKALSWTNTATAKFEGVDINTDGVLGPEETRWVFVPKTPEFFNHDADGNLTSDGKWLYTWDGENRLIAMQTQASLPSAMPAVRMEFVYDYLSRRCVKRLYGPSTGGENLVAGSAVMEGASAAVVQSDDEPVAAGTNSVIGVPIGWTLVSTFKFVWDGWNLLGEFDGNDDVLRTCAWGLDLSGSEQGAGGIGGLVFEYLSKTESTHHVYYDGNGNVTSLRDNAGAVSAGYDYGPFGETLTARGVEGALIANAFKFSTKYADAESGLLYYGYRFYNPGTGRWLNRDPIEESDSPSLYQFVSNNTSSGIDARGLRKLEVAFVAFILGSRGNKVSGFSGTWAYEPYQWTNELFGSQYMFGTDDRAFGQFYKSGLSARIFSRIWVDTSSIGNTTWTDSDWQVHSRGKVTAEHRAGMSHRLSRRSNNTLTGWSSWVYSEKRAENDHFKSAVRDSGPCETTVTVSQSASNPFISQAPNIDYEVSWIFRAKNNSEVEVELSGTHNRFPDYESYVDRRADYARKSKSDGPGILNLGVTWNRISPRKVRVSGVDVPKDCGCNMGADHRNK